MDSVTSIPFIVWLNLAALCAVLAAVAAVPWLLALAADRWLWSRRRRD